MNKYSNARVEKSSINFNTSEAVLLPEEVHTSEAVPLPEEVHTSEAVLLPEAVHTSEAVLSPEQVHTFTHFFLLCVSQISYSNANETSPPQ